LCLFQSTVLMYLFSLIIFDPVLRNLSKEWKPDLIFLLKETMFSKKNIFQERYEKQQCTSIQWVKKKCVKGNGPHTHTHTHSVSFPRHKVLKWMTKGVCRDLNENDSELVKDSKCYEKNCNRHWIEYIGKTYCSQCLGICFICLALSKLVIHCQEIIRSHQKSQLHLVHFRFIVSKRRLVMSVTLIRYQLWKIGPQKGYKLVIQS
jgi:hypothetical protein